MHDHITISSRLLVSFYFLDPSRKSFCLQVFGPLFGNTLFTEDDFKLLENFDMDLYARKVRDQVCSYCKLLDWQTSSAETVEIKKKTLQQLLWWRQRCDVKVWVLQNWILNSLWRSNVVFLANVTNSASTDCFSLYEIKQTASFWKAFLSSM